ncbi:MAG TPA: hypothetical protein VIG64_05580 [Actinomycetota bacterium]
MSRSTRVVATALIAACALSAAPAAGAVPSHAYTGLGSWVDLYNKRPWKHPDRVVAELTQRGVQTLYLETSSYKFKTAIVHPNAVGEYIDLAHDNGMTVVAWYVPSFKPVARDLRRVRAAIDYVSPGGGSFDSFALDIEATVVQDVTERNARTRKLSRAIRRYAGDGYALGAIVPDPVGSVYWTDFPYPALGRLYDAFMPMSYFTFRVEGPTAVRRYIRANVRAVRERTGVEDLPVHPIGGIADAAKLSEVKAYVRAVFAESAVGGSLYDFPLMRAGEWKRLARLRSKREAPADPGILPETRPAHPHLV